VIELRKRRVLTIVVGSVFICSFILALMYPVISARYRGKIHFLKSPNAIATFIPPVGKEANTMFVWVAVFMDSSFGSFNMAMYGYESYDYDTNGNLIKIHDEYHWFTDNLRAGEVLGYLTKKVYPSYDGTPIEYVSNDVTLARINIETSEHQLNATVIAKGKTLFTVGLWANTGVPIESRIETGSPYPPETFLSVEAYYPTLQALVTGLEVGDFTGGRFKYIDTELYDSSLLPRIVFHA
jgi:hypothetical protein